MTEIKGNLNPFAAVISGNPRLASALAFTMGEGGSAMEERKRPRGFASMDPERQREIARKGGRASSGNFANNPARAAEAGRKGGENSPGNFARDRERAAEAGRKGGRRTNAEATQSASDDQSGTDKDREREV